ncbi:putrescine transporter subunit: membrane component of ABC superfamily [Thiomonas arsenitoxydans]|uniref:Putrescine transport system permease protein potI n=1 Tax=Thiomonas arsenitoxydans (strain DSM 22701 / CIP 110005 / 3As) TaxID=426114 RepID=D6CQR8_THIA3|nr:ABC transporter permease subunit [Thiomonas arsenitoxydans]CAZ86959.1 Putrescine transport system permease protein potI [Thiomonas arsenitoxydans]CQR27860.1 putrescine transporter subunit: membrane component of ABC superfamily [Thiomonas arsenitoxydans]CQR30218.1 putrescine transporter subunit: membrane component of ABC superfamily [Thiomonas arsenitoxydans]CQR32162.1 putrescine transporter subunit: membrane component of ABC superfamily [Thiomonas arsenitoxydans]CQR34193.1 putrescine transp
MKKTAVLPLTWMILVYLFLYLPIVVLVVYSFNDSRMVTIWGGWTLKWYGAVVHDHEVISGLILSLKVALATATTSVLLGTLAAFALVRYRHFAGKSLLNFMINIPLVMPTVVIALALLLFFVTVQKAMGFPQKGFFTIFIGHTVMAISYAAVVIQSRLKEMDRSIEEAAMDLGARPFQVFMLVTLPSISQALVSAWLLAFSLSLDEVVISAFLSGPGSTTLPVVIFSRARLGLSPTINVVGAITVYLVIIAVAVSSLLMARRERLRAKQAAQALRMDAEPQQTKEFGVGFMTAEGR